MQSYVNTIFRKLPKSSFLIHSNSRLKWWPLQKHQKITLATNSHISRIRQKTTITSTPNSKIRPAFGSFTLTGDALIHGRICQPNTSLFFSTSAGNANKKSSYEYEPDAYTVAKISYLDGEIHIQDLTVSDILRHGDIGKSSSMKMHARDLFSLALTSRQEHAKATGKKMKKKRPPTAILPRKGDIIVSFGKIRALVGPEFAFIFDAHKTSVQLLASQLAFTFARKAQMKLKMQQNASNSTDEYSDDPHELIFLEGILREVCDTYNRRVKLYEPIVENALSHVSNDILSDSGIHRLLPVKNSLQKFEMKIKAGLSCLTHLLENDEDMLRLLLAENLAAEEKGELLEHRRHESVELLVEEYARQLESLLQETRYLLKQVQSKQELVAISLDSYRNRIIRMSLYISIASLGFATSTTVAGFFGMNLINGYEESPTAFMDVVAGTSAAGALLLGGCMAYIGGPIMQRMAKQGLDELSTINGALSDMSTLDIVMKKIAHDSTRYSKEEFKEVLLGNRCQTSSLKEREVDLLFEMMDSTKDGYVYGDDFTSLTNEDTMKQIPLQEEQK